MKQQQLKSSRRLAVCTGTPVLIAIIFLSSFVSAEAQIYAPAGATKILDTHFNNSYYYYQKTWKSSANPFGSWTGTIRGNNWANLPARKDSYYNYIVRGDKSLGEYITCTRYAVPMWWGGNGQAHVMQVKKDDSDTGAVSRVQYNWFPKKAVRDIYIQYYMRVENNLEDSMDQTNGFTWRQAMEFRDTKRNNALRRSELFMTYKKVGGVPSVVWEGRTEDMTSSAAGLTFNIIETKQSSTEIPTYNWFLLTVHYKHDPVNGAFEAGINVVNENGGGFVAGTNKTLFSMKGIATSVGSGDIDFVNFMKIYVSKTFLNNAAARQLIYHVRVWDNTGN